MPCTITLQSGWVSRARSGPDADALLRVELPGHELSEDTVVALAVSVAELLGVRPPEVEWDSNRRIRVELQEPERIERGRATWRISPALTLVHEGWSGGYLRLASSTDDDGASEGAVDLDPMQAWVLVRALVSLRTWQRHLQAAFAAAAESRREEAMGTRERLDELPTVFAGVSSRYVEVGQPHALPWRVAVTGAGARCEPAGGEAQTVHLELDRTLTPDGRMELARRLAGIAGVVPTSWLGAEGDTEVRYVPPTTGAVHRLVWRANADLCVAHGSERTVELLDGGDEPVPRVELDVRDARRLLQVLVSIQGWEDELDVCIEAVERQRRLQLVALIQDRRSRCGGPMPTVEVEARRRAVHDALVPEFGRARGCDEPRWLPRWVLLEQDVLGKSAGAWHVFGDDPEELLKTSCGQEYPEDWPPFLLVDLDSGVRRDVDSTTHADPEWVRPARRAKVVVDGRKIAVR